VVKAAEAYLECFDNFADIPSDIVSGGRATMEHIKNASSRHEMLEALVRVADNTSDRLERLEKFLKADRGLDHRQVKRFMASEKVKWNLPSPEDIKADPYTHLKGLLRFETMDRLFLGSFGGNPEAFVRVDSIVGQCIAKAMKAHDGDTHVPKQEVVAAMSRYLGEAAARLFQEVAERSPKHFVLDGTASPPSSIAQSRTFPTSWHESGASSLPS
jgi:hypothetical protein